MTGPASGTGVAGATAGRRLGQLAELPVTVLRGVGAGVAADLTELGVTTVLDLVTHYPRRYIDGTRMVTIDRLAEGEKATVLATVAASALLRPGAVAAGGHRPGSRST